MKDEHKDPYCTSFPNLTKDDFDFRKNIGKEFIPSTRLLTKKELDERDIFGKDVESEREKAQEFLDYLLSKCKEPGFINRLKKFIEEFNKN